MYIDRQNLFGQDQAVTTSAATTDYIDLGAARDIGNGERPEILVLCTQDVTAAGAATVTVALQSDDNPSFSSPANLVLSDAIPKASLTAGAQVLRVAVPYGTERYLRLFYTVGTGPLTAGKFTSGLVPLRQANVAYASGYTA
ncbi:Bbp16 family capsid cement protein [Reyranella sp.]|uniref:Bbp16 family capsid cement protein n=1 Tax=Reyranella sp. TaxID=1929291 RepID=UPI00272F945D|nr:hypothetical protein [Reyranella sp.]MDP2376417.1 hypothetical protein [Reyranella sp.]